MDTIQHTEVADYNHGSHRAMSFAEQFKGYTVVAEHAYYEGLDDA